MQQLAPASQQRSIGGVLHQRVLEDVDRLGRRAAAEDQLGRDQLVEGRLAAPPRADRRPRRAARGRTRARSPRRSARPPSPGASRSSRAMQRVVQRRWDRERRQRAGQLVAVARRPRAAPIRAPSWSAPRRTAARRRSWPTICVDDLGGQRLAAGDPVDHRGALAPAEPGQGERVTCGCAGPGRRELGPEGDQQQHRQALRCARPASVEQLLRGRVDPVHVLVDRSAPAAPPRAPRADRPGPRASAASGAAASARAAGSGSPVGIAEQRGEQRRRLGQRRSVPRASSASSLSSFASGGSSRAKPAARSSCSMTGWSGAVRCGRASSE